jgi:hypothetical protein
MKKVIVFASVLVFTFGGAGIGRATLLGSAVWEDGVTSQETFSSINFSLSYDGVSASSIFNSLNVTTSDVATEFLATSSSGSYPDTGFDTFVALLTNGSDELLFFKGGASGLGNNESDWFGTSPDFQSYIVEALGLKINSLSFETFSDPIYEGVRTTDAAWNVTFNVYGTAPQGVPEPSTMLLLGSGLVGLIGFRRKLKR